MKHTISAAAAAVLVVGGGAFIAGQATADTDQAHAQISTSFDQSGGGRVELDTIDSIAGAALDTDTDTVIVEEDGLWLAVAAPQVGGFNGEAKSGSANFWLDVNGTDVANSNVTWASQQKGDADVIVSQGVLMLEAGDEVGVDWSTTGPNLEAIETPGEPLTPSIILTLVKVGE